MEGNRPQQAGAQTSAWCTRAIWTLLARYGKVQEAAIVLYRTGEAGLRLLLHDLIDLDAVSYTGNAATLLLQMLLESTNWQSLAAALTTRYDPEAEYLLVQVGAAHDAGEARPVIAATIFADADAALAAARAWRQTESSTDVIGIEVRRQPRFPAPHEVLPGLPAADMAAQAKQRAG